MKTILSALFSALALAATSQTNVFDIGIEGGGGMAMLRGNQSIVQVHDPRLGIIAGLFGQYNFEKILSIRTGVYFERKGSSFDIIFTDQNGTSLGTVKGNEQFDYLTVPLLVRATFGKKLGYFVNAGGYYGHLLKQTERIDPFRSYPGSSAVHTTSFWRSDAGVTLGLGLSYSLKAPIAISLEVRDNLGLTDTSKLPTYNGGTIKNNALNVLLGVCYKIGKRGAVVVG